MAKKYRFLTILLDDWFSDLERRVLGIDKYPSYNVYDRYGGRFMGQVTWYKRAYYLHPCDDSAWSKGRLADVQNFIESLEN